MLLRSSLESFSALALPPFNPPSLPRETAAGFLTGFWGFSVRLITSEIML
jgi:hypothetical protein